MNILITLVSISKNKLTFNIWNSNFCTEACQFSHIRQDLPWEADGTSCLCKVKLLIAKT